MEKNMKKDVYNHQITLINNTVNQLYVNEINFLKILI